MRILKTLLLALLMAFPGLAQVPSPQVPLTGTPGSAGNFPFLPNGTFAMPSDANYTVIYPNTSCIVCVVTSSVSLTTTRNLVEPGPGSPVAKMTYNITNATSGGQSIQVISTSGTGVTIANGNSAWVYFDGTNYREIDAPGGVSGITALTGDGTATGPGSAALTLATVNSSPGTCGDATHVCQIVDNAKGLVTSQTQVAITGAAGAVLLAPSGAQNIVQPVVSGVQTNFSINGNVNCTGTAATGPCITPGRNNEASLFERLHACSFNGNVCNIFIYGDSLQKCWGYPSKQNCSQSVGPTVSFNRQVEQLRIRLQSLYGYAGTGFIPVISDVGGTLDSDFYTISGTFSLDSFYGPSQAGTSGGTILMNPGTVLTFDTTGTLGSVTGVKFPGDRLDIACNNSPGSVQTPTLTVDGTPVASPVLCGTGTAAPEMIEFSGFTNTTHTVTLTCPGGTGVCTFAGAGWRSGTHGVSISNLATGGANSNWYGSAPTTQFAFVNLWPDSSVLVLDAFGGDNDSQMGVSPTTFQTNTNNLITYELTAPATPAIGLIVTPITATSGAATNFPLYAAKQAIMRDTYNLAYVDSTDQWGKTYSNTFNLYNPSGSFAGLHFSDAGASSMASMYWTAFFDNLTPPSEFINGTTLALGSLPTQGGFLGSINAGEGHFSGGARFDTNCACWIATASTGFIFSPGGTAGQGDFYTTTGTAGKAASLTLLGSMRPNGNLSWGPSGNVLLSAAGGVYGLETTAPAGMSTYDILYPKSGTHRFAENANNAGEVILSGVSAAKTSGNCAEFATNGIDLIDAGAACGTSGSGISGLTAGFIPLAGSATTLTGNSPLDYGITTALTLTSTAPLAITSSSGLGGGFNGTEGTAPTGATSIDDIWADSTAHRLKENPNNAGAIILGGIASAGTAGHCLQLATNGIDYSDSGSACGGGGSGTVGSGTIDGAAYYTGTTTTGSTTAPITSGHTYFLAWQPSGSAIAPAPLDIASPPTIGGTTGVTLAAPSGQTVSTFINSNLTFQESSAANLSTVPLSVSPQSPATNVANFNSPAFNWLANYWNGAASATDTVSAINISGAGTNPTQTLTFAHTGSSGAFKIAIPALDITGITGSTQCIQADTNGNLSGTGSACGSGGTSGTINSGSGFALPAYASGAGTTIGPVSIFTEVTGTQLGINIAPTHALDATSSSSATTLTGTNTAELEIANSNGTTNTFEGFATKATNSSAASVTMSKEVTVNTSLTAGAENGTIHWLTRDAGTLTDWMNLNNAGTLAGQGGNWSLTNAGVLTVVSCTGCGGGTVTGTANQIVVTGSTISLSPTIVFPGTISSTTAGAASTPMAVFSGAPFAGTGTTSFPLMDFNTVGTARTTLNTGGTYIGIDANSGFAGNFQEFRVNNGNPVFTVGSTGTIGSGAWGNNSATASITATGRGTFATIFTLTQCSSTASPAVCVAAASGTVQLAAAATSLQVNTTAITATSVIGCLTYNTVGITAPTNLASLITPSISAITAGTSFTLTFPVAPLTNPVNIGYCIIH